MVFVELPDVGKEVSQGDELAVVESVKAASEIYAPVGGTVLEVNEDLENAPDMINESAEEDGWFLKLDISDEEELSDLMSEKEYTKYLETLG